MFRNPIGTHGLCRIFNFERSGSDECMCVCVCATHMILVDSMAKRKNTESASFFVRWLPTVFSSSCILSCSFVLCSPMVGTHSTQREHSRATVTHENYFRSVGSAAAKDVRRTVRFELRVVAVRSECTLRNLHFVHGLRQFERSAAISVCQATLPLSFLLYSAERA